MLADDDSAESAPSAALAVKLAVAEKHMAHLASDARTNGIDSKIEGKFEHSQHGSLMVRLVVPSHRIVGSYDGPAPGDVQGRMAAHCHSRARIGLTGPMVLNRAF